MKHLVCRWSTAVVIVLLACITLASFGCNGTSTTTSAAGSTSSATAGTSDTTAAEVPVTGGTVTIAISEPAFIDPVNLVESEGIQVGNALFDSLVAYDPKTSELVPAVAESWESNEDATVWTFHIRKGSTFHNGREVTAQDFKYAWERICDPENESMVSYHLAAIKGFDEMQNGQASNLAGVKVTNDYTLEVTLAYPFADFEYVVGHPALAPVPQEEVEKDLAAYAEMPVGNGPFKMTEPWNHDQYIKVARFDNYYGGAPYVDGVDFNIFPDPEAAFLEFRAGTVDFSAIPSSEVEAVIDQYGKSPDGLEVSPGQQAVLGPELSTYFFVFNTEDPILENADLRRAISLAINRDTVAEVIFGGLRQSASSIIPPGVLGYEEGAWPYSHFDRAQASELLAAAGYPDGDGLPELTLLTNSGGGHEQVMELFQADLASIGVQSRIESIEAAQYLENLSTGNFQIARCSWTADYPIIDSFLHPLFYSESGNNAGHYTNQAVDAAIIDARKITTSADRIAAYRDIVQMVGEDAPAVPVVAYNHQYVGSDRIHGLIYSPLGLCNLESCWLSAN